MRPDLVFFVRGIRQQVARFSGIGISRRCAVFALPAEISMKPLRRCTSAHVRRSNSSERTPANAWWTTDAASLGAAVFKKIRLNGAFSGIYLRHHARKENGSQACVYAVLGHFSETLPSSPEASADRNGIIPAEQAGFLR